MKTNAFPRFGFDYAAAPRLAALAAAVLTLSPLWAAPSQQAYVKASNTGAHDFFGVSVAVSGDTMVVGANWEASNATGVNGNQGDNSADGAGAAYVFVRSGTNWMQQAYLKASNTRADDNFGSSVGVSGDTVVVGARNESGNATGVNGQPTDYGATNSGAAYIFIRNGTNWIQQAYLKASNAESYDNFGWSVAVSGDTVVVGALTEASNATGVNGNQGDNSAFESGAAYVFVRSETDWSQQAYMKASNTEGGIPGVAFGDRFGSSVAVSGDTAVVGAYGESSNATGVDGNQHDNSAEHSGAAYVFARSGTNWTQQAYLKASNTKAGDGFGVRVTVSGNTVVVGSPSESSNATGVNGDQGDTNAPGAGAAYVFARSGSNWTQQAYVKASNTESNDYLGTSVAVSGDTLVVGAGGESSGARGINGNQSNNSAKSAGAGYIFVRSGTNWSQDAYLKASNADGPLGGDFQGDTFGASVAVSGDTVVIGAFGEDSGATGINGNQNDNSVAFSGAAYVFTDLGIGPSLALASDGGGGYFVRFAGHAGFSYRLLRASSLSGPWSAIATNTAPPSGLVEVHDASPLTGQAFYRTVQP